MKHTQMDDLITFVRDQSMDSQKALSAPGALGQDALRNQFIGRRDAYWNVLLYLQDLGVL